MVFHEWIIAQPGMGVKNLNMNQIIFKIMLTEDRHWNIMACVMQYGYRNSGKKVVLAFENYRYYADH